MKTLLLFLLSFLSVFAADPAQPKVGPTPVINATNGYGGILTVRTQINVGYTGESGIIEWHGSVSSNYGAAFMSPSNFVFSVNAEDEYDGGAFTFGTTNEITKADLFQLLNGTDLKVYIQYDGSILGRRLFAEDAPFSDDYTRIQPTNTKINIGVNTNYISFDAATGIIEMFHEGTNTFKVNQDSGYSGSGTKFLSDDATYKPSNFTNNTGSGDSVWTNNAGVIQIVGSTNVLLNPDVADGASAVAFSLNSSNALPTIGAKLLTVGNGGTNQTTLANRGNIIVGQTILDEYGDDLNASLRSLRITSIDGLSHNNLFLESANNTDYDQDAWVELNNGVESDVTASIAIHANNSTNANAFVQFEVNSTDLPNAAARFRAGFGSTQVDLNPTAADGSTPYLFDTSIAHTSGNLMEVKNNGTNVAYFKYDGSLTSERGANSAVLGVSSGGTPYISGTSALQLSGGSGTVTLSANSLTPSPDNSVDAGTASFGFRVGYFGSGVSSKATDAAVTIAATGWTNTFGKNATVYMDSVAGITYTVYNDAGTAVYTNSVSALNSTVNLQPSGKVIITAGTLAVGRATPF